MALLAILIGCRDGPAKLTLPVEPETPVAATPTVPPDAILTIQQMMEDPLVREIVEALGDQTVADGFDGIREVLSRQSVQPDLLAVRRALMTTRDFVAGDSEGADIVPRHVLQLVLDDAGTMLVGDMDVAPLEETEGDDVKHGEGVKH